MAFEYSKGRNELIRNYARGDSIPEIKSRMSTWDRIVTRTWPWDDIVYEYKYWSGDNWLRKNKIKSKKRITVSDTLWGMPRITEMKKKVWKKL